MAKHKKNQQASRTKINVVRWDPGQHITSSVQLLSVSW